MNLIIFPNFIILFITKCNFKFKTSDNLFIFITKLLYFYHFFCSFVLFILMENECQKNWKWGSHALWVYLRYKYNINRICLEGIYKKLNFAHFQKFIFNFHTYLSSSLHSLLNFFTLMCAFYQKNNETSNNKRKECKRKRWNQIVYDLNNKIYNKNEFWLRKYENTYLLKERNCWKWHEF